MGEAGLHSYAGRRSRLASLGAAVPWLLASTTPALALLGFGAARAWSCDDAFIDFRVVEHLLAGDGPVFNVGERVEAYTNPLWVALLALVTGALRWFNRHVVIEWVACALSLAAATVALVLAAHGARRWHEAARGEQAASRAGAGSPQAASPSSALRLVPLGALCVAALPPFWDYATSGLETSLALLWLSLSYLLLGASSPLTALVLSLGPLVRPDLGVYTVLFFAAHLLRAPRPRRWRVGQLAALLGAPLTYQAFRMGYFGAMVPNTALAKEAGLSDWGRGAHYLGDFAAPYALWLPAALLVWIAARPLLGLIRAGRWRLAAVAAAPPCAALLHTLYVMRVGGDFMHARLLLPAFFAWVLPAAVVPWPTSRRHQALHALVLAWCAVCAAALRAPYANDTPPMRDGISDERGFYVMFTRRPHPITAADYARSPLWQLGVTFRNVGARRVLLMCCGDWHGADQPRLSTVPLSPTMSSSVAVAQVLGVSAFVAGTRVHVVDRLGLADPLASRLRLVQRDRPGHEKFLPDPWILARFADARALAQSPSGREAEDARQALGCGDLGELMHAITEPLTLDRFLKNIALAPRLSALRFDQAPSAARAELCTPGA